MSFPQGPSCWQTGLLTCSAHEGTEDLLYSFLGFLAGSEVWLGFGDQLFPEEDVPSSICLLRIEIYAFLGNK